MASWFVSLRLVLLLSMIPSTKNTDLGSFEDSEGKRSIYYRLWRKLMRSINVPHKKAQLI